MGGSITGNLETRGDRDWFRVELQAGNEYQFNLNGNTLSDTYLRLLDSNGNLVTENDDANGSLNSQIVFRANTSGTYYLSAGSYNDSLTGTYTLSSSLRDSYSEITGYGETRVDLALAQLLGVNVPRVSDLGGNNWGLDRIGAPEAWAMGYRGQGTVVAVLDTGVDWTHSDLNDNIWINTDEIAGNGIDDDRNGYIDDVRGWDFAYGDNNPNDVQGHGTHVAGTIAAEANNIGISGVAPDAKIMAVKVLGDDGSGYITDIAAGIRYAVDNGAHVINMSLGGGGVNPTINSAIQYATSRGSLVVMAAGNSGGDSPENPGAYAAENGLVVGAINSNGDIAGFSNRAGGEQDFNGDGLRVPNYVTAAGVSVYSTVPGGGFARYSGTSMATPHVAGAAAILMGAAPNLSPAQVADLITGTAVQGGSGALSSTPQPTSLQTAGLESGTFYAWV